MQFMRNPKDFWSGIIYVFIGLAVIVLGRDYGMGTTLRMGPAYFPSVLGAALALIGAISLIRSFLRPGEPVGAFAVKALVLILVGTLLTGFLVRGAGIVVVLPLLVLISAYASSKFRLATIVMLAAGLTVFCALVFVKGLTIPLPIVGPWLGG
jgi:hypothetical protein